MRNPEIEVYRLTQPKQYCRNYAHTDCIEYIEGTMTNEDVNIEKYKGKIILNEVMDYEMYSNSVDANTSETWTEEDYPEEGINVIVVED
jgi:hypothetical protein